MTIGLESKAKYFLPVITASLDEDKHSLRVKRWKEIFQVKEP
jgi:hypothetical protein